MMDSSQLSILRMGDFGFRAAFQAARWAALQTVAVRLSVLAAMSAGAGADAAGGLATAGVGLCAAGGEALAKGRKRPSGPRGGRRRPFAAGATGAGARRGGWRGAFRRGFARFRIAVGGRVRLVGTGIGRVFATASSIGFSGAVPHTGHSPGLSVNFVRQSGHSATNLPALLIAEPPGRGDVARWPRTPEPGAHPG